LLIIIVKKELLDRKTRDILDLSSVDRDDIAYLQVAFKIFSRLDLINT
jgi:hypothetical protein